MLSDILNVNDSPVRVINYCVVLIKCLHLTNMVKSRDPLFFLVIEIKECPILAHLYKCPTLFWTQIVEVIYVSGKIGTCSAALCD